MTSNSQPKFLGHLKNVRPNGTGWTACCPAHNDKNPSLSIAPGKNGGVVVHCHAGCTPEAIIAACGLTLADLAPPGGAAKPCTARSTTVAEHNYRDEDGVLLFQVVRKEPKGFHQRRPDGNGGWINNMAGVRRIPYRLPELLAAADETIYIVEGEKDADALAAPGLIATTNAGGGGKWKSLNSATVKKAFAGRRVVILPDNDDTGHSHGLDVAERLEAIAAEVKIVELPGLPEKGDVSDWLAAGGTREALLKLAAETPAWERGAESPAAPEQRENDPRPLVEVRTTETETVAEVLALLAADESLYENDSGRLVELVRNRRTNALRIVGLDRFALRLRIVKRARFYSMARTADGVEVERPRHPPDWLVGIVGGAGAREGFRRLNSLSPAPFLRPDGTVCAAMGYDAASGVYLDFSLDLPEIPVAPTQAQAAEAAATLMQLVEESPFAGPAHASAWLSLVLTLLTRPAYPESPAPQFIIDGNREGCGKGFLADLAGIIARGRKLPVGPELGNNDETRKLLTALMMEGCDALLFDNCHGKIGGSAIEMAATSTERAGRALGTNAIASGQFSATTVYTSNNARLSRDMARRSIMVMLTTTEDYPEDRKFRRAENPHDEARRRRPELLAAAFTILRGYIAAGRPKLGLSPFGTFGEWSGLVRSAIVWAGRADPCDTRSEVRDRDDDSRLLLRVLTELLPPTRDTPLTAKQIIEAAAQNEELKNALSDALYNPKELTTRALGKLLTANDRRPAGGMILRASNGGGGIKRFWVEQKSPPADGNPPVPLDPPPAPAPAALQGGLSGLGGSDSPAAEIEPDPGFANW